MGFFRVLREVEYMMSLFSLILLGFLGYVNIETLLIIHVVSKIIHKISNKYLSQLEQVENSKHTSYAKA
jgi:hypothetical protein